MTTNVLVAYRTTNGSTARIAESVTDVLRKEGLTAETAPAGSVEDVTRYDAVVIGGGLYAGRRHKDACRFVRRNRRALAEHPVWLFSSGPLDPSASEREIPPVPRVRRAMLRLEAREHVTFGGCLREGAKGQIARMILRNGKVGDFRDFPRIEQWAARIAGDIEPRAQHGSRVRAERSGAGLSPAGDANPEAGAGGSPVRREQLIRSALLHWPGVRSGGNGEIRRSTAPTRSGALESVVRPVTRWWGDRLCVPAADSDQARSLRSIYE